VQVPAPIKYRSRAQRNDQGMRVVAQQPSARKRNTKAPRYQPPFPTRERGHDENFNRPDLTQTASEVRYMDMPDVSAGVQHQGWPQAGSCRYVAVSSNLTGAGRPHFGFSGAIAPDRHFIMR
jgi:hypothetical protein